MNTAMVDTDTIVSDFNCMIGCYHDSNSKVSALALLINLGPVLLVLYPNYFLDPHFQGKTPYSIVYKIIIWSSNNSLQITAIYYR